MGKKIECRVSEEYYNEVKEYARGLGVSITDVVITGINSQLHEKDYCPDKSVITEKHGVETCPDKEPEKPIIKAKDVPGVIEKIVEKKVASGGFFKPYLKEYQTRNNGKKG